MGRSGQDWCLAIEFVNSIVEITATSSDNSTWWLSACVGNRMEWVQILLLLHFDFLPYQIFPSFGSSHLY